MNHEWLDGTGQQAALGSSGSNATARALRAEETLTGPRRGKPGQGTVTGHPTDQDYHR